MIKDSTFGTKQYQIIVVYIVMEQFTKQIQSLKLLLRRISVVQSKLQCVERMMEVNFQERILLIDSIYSIKE